MARILCAALLLVLTACGSGTSEDPPGHTARPPVARVVGIVSSPGAGMTADLRRRVASVVRRHPAQPGRVLVTRVVHVGCLTPDHVDVRDVGGVVVLSADSPQESSIDCITALASAAVVEVAKGTEVRVDQR
jgi:hypothetical protein